MKIAASLLLVCIVALDAVQGFAQAQANACHVGGETRAATAPARVREGVGKVHMAITTKSAEAQKFFDQGLALLHSFWSYEADRSFARAAGFDPDCAMAYWGMAFANVNEARRNDAIEKAKALTAKVSDRERLYIEAVEARYQGNKAAVQNNPGLGATEPYKAALRRLVAAYPDDLEAKLFLALALLSGYERDGTPKPGTVEAVALCQLVLARSPNHPAAHHYLIHALEAGRRPQDAAASADVYGLLAPKIPHAVHMPGHIYVHINRWDDAARVFSESAAIDRDYMRSEHETSDHTSGPYSHNLHFLATVYGYQGRYRDGVRTAQELLDKAKEPGEATSRVAIEGRMAMLRLLVRFERWDEILDGKTLPDDGGFQFFGAWRHWAMGVAHAGKGQLDAARSELAKLQSEIARLKDELAKHKEWPQASIQERYARAFTVAPLELQGRILLGEGKGDEAIAVLRQGLEEEIKVGYAEPPLYPQPMEEVLGKSLLVLKRWSEAEAMFRAALERDAGSGRALFGLMQAYAGAGKDKEARTAQLQFKEAWKAADADLPEMRDAKTFAATSTALRRR